MPTHTLFPPFHPQKSWRAVDDRIRGGSSVSHLDPLAEPSAGAVRFWGTLDTQTLGGAGFASQCHAFEQGLRLPQDEYAGLAITFSAPSAKQPAPHHPASTEKPKPVKPYEYTLTLKTSTPSLRPDGRRESTISYEHTFPLPTNTTASSRLVIPWHAFEATYRGRPLPATDPTYIPLDPGSTTRDGKARGGIAEMSIMCRSAFGRQEGEFDLRVIRIEAVGVEERAWDLEAQGKGRRFRGTLFSLQPGYPVRLM